MSRNEGFDPGDVEVATYIVLGIQVRNEGWYEVASEEILNSSGANQQAKELFDKYYAKLKNKFFHLKTPVPRAIRCSQIDQMAVVYR